MFDLGEMLELVVDGCYQRALAQQQFVQHREQLVLHVFAQRGDKLSSLSEESGKEGLRDIPAIAKDLTLHFGHEGWHGDTIIDNSDREATGKQLPDISDQERGLQP